VERNDAIEVCHLADPAATEALGRKLAARLSSHGRDGRAALLLLQGELGAGKTSLVQGLAAGLGITEPITSPTFALAQHYDNGSGPGVGSAALVHLDLYRLEQSAAADELFAQEEEEASHQGAVLAVEWPERLSFRPEGAWQVALTQAGDGRLARITPPGFTPPRSDPAELR
jgi:tRNA threonylcarbamoyladenosine biosynthesis protein TsaE